MTENKKKRKCIFFGNLDPEIDAKWLGEIVMPFGEGFNARIIPPKKESSSSYGFIEMEAGDADRLLEFFSTNDLTYWDRKITVSEAKTGISPRSHAIKLHICSKILAKQKKKQQKKPNRWNSDHGHSPKE